MDAVKTIDLESLVLLRGSHDGRMKDGKPTVCAMEAVAWLAGEGHTDHPVCVSPVLGAYVRRLNDVLDERGRQRLKPYLPRLIGTAGDDAADRRRGWMAA